MDQIEKLAAAEEARRLIEDSGIELLKALYSDLEEKPRIRFRSTKAKRRD